MVETDVVALGDVAFECVRRFGEPNSEGVVYGVDKSVGLTNEPRYQSANLSRYKRVDPGMFAYNPMRLNIGSIGFCSDQHESGIVSPDYVVFECDRTQLLPEFLYFHTKTRFWQNWLALAGQGSVRERIYFKNLAQYELHLPPLAYQAAAVHVLMALQDQIELNRRMNATLEGMAQAIFRDWFVDFGPVRRKLAGATDPVAILGGLIPDAPRAAELAAIFPDALGGDGWPEGWTVSPLDRLIEFNPRESISKGAQAPYTDMASLPTIGSIAESPIFREFSSGMKFRNGDALLARITPCLENGKAAFVDFLPASHPVGWGSTEFIVMRARANRAKPIAYLVSRWPEFRAAAIQSMTGTSGRQRANAEALQRFEFVHAPDAVHEAFGQIIVPMFDKISHGGAENRTLAETRDYLLPRLMSGKIRVAEAEAIAA